MHGYFKEIYVYSSKIYKILDSRNRNPVIKNQGAPSFSPLRWKKYAGCDVSPISWIAEILELNP